MPSWQLAFRSIRRRAGAVMVSAAVSVAAIAVPASASTLHSHTAPAETWVIMSRAQFGGDNQWALNNMVTVDWSQAPNWNSYSRLTWYRCSSTPSDPVNSSDCTAIAMANGGVSITNEESGKYLVGVGYIYDSNTDTYTAERSNYSPQIGTIEKPCISAGTVCDLTLSVDDWGTNTLHWGPVESPMFSQVPITGYQVSEVNPLMPGAPGTSICTITDVSVTSCVIPFTKTTLMMQTLKNYAVRPIVTGSPFPMPAAKIAIRTPERPGIGGIATPHGFVIGSGPGSASVGLNAGTEFTINGKTCSYTWPLNYAANLTGFDAWGGDCSSLPSTWGGFDLGAFQTSVDSIFNLTAGATYQLTGKSTYWYQYGVAYSDMEFAGNNLRLFVKDLPISAQITTPTDWPASPTNVSFVKNSDGTYHLEWTYTGDSQTYPQVTAKDASGAAHYGSCGSTVANTGTQFSCDVTFYDPPSEIASWGNLTNFQLTLAADITSSTLTQATTPTEAQSRYFDQSLGSMFDNGPGWMGISISSWGDATGAHSGSSGGGSGGSGGSGGGATAPGAPTGVSGSAGNGQATVTWNAPSSTGGASITGYTVQYSSNGGSTWQTASCTGTSTSCVISGLTNGTNYIFKVAATNSAGTGSYSSNSANVAPTAPSSPTTPGVPTLGTTTATDTGITVRWTAPSSNGGSSITGYTVNVLDGSGNIIGTCTTTGTSCTVSPLTPGTTYTVSLVANNAQGHSTAATKSVATTNTAGKKAKRFYIRRYAKGQLGVRAKQIKQIQKAVTAIVKSGSTTIRITGWTNTGAKKIKSTTRATNVTKVVNKQLVKLHATSVQVTTVGGGGTKKFGGTVLNRVVVIRGK